MATTDEIGDLAAVEASVPGKEKAPQWQGFRGMERAGIEPATSGLQSRRSPS
jgi:hypothetical protein